MLLQGAHDSVDVVLLERVSSPFVILTYCPLVCYFARLRLLLGHFLSSAISSSAMAISPSGIFFLGHFFLRLLVFRIFHDPGVFSVRQEAPHFRLFWGFMHEWHSRSTTRSACPVKLPHVRLT